MALAAVAAPTDDEVRAVPPPVKPLRLAADANVRAGERPEESLRSVRRAGDEHATLSEATDDAVRMIGELRHQE